MVIEECLMLPHKNGKFAISKSKSSRLSYILTLRRLSLSISSSRSRNDE